MKDFFYILVIILISIFAWCEHLQLEVSRSYIDTLLRSDRLSEIIERQRFRETISNYYDNLQDE